MTEKSARRTLLLWPGIEHNLLRAKERKTIERWVVLDGEDAVTLGLVGPGVWTDEAGGWLHPLTEDGEAVLALAYKTGCGGRARSVLVFVPGPPEAQARVQAHRSGR